MKKSVLRVAICFIIIIFCVITSTATASPSLPPDLNDDNTVNVYDYNILLANFNTTGNPGWISADLNNNGRIDIFDYNILLGNFGRSLNTTPTPIITNNIISLNPQIVYQIIIGWETVSQAGEDDSPYFNDYKNTLFDQAVNDLGINRIRVEIVAKNNVFDTTELNRKIDTVVLPIKQKLEARGEKLFINVCFVGSRNNSTFNTNPNGYAQEVLSTYRHLQSRYGFIPDGWEIILEPGWVALPKWSGEQIGKAIVATGDLLKANNFPIYFIAPSAEGGPDISLNFFDNMITQEPRSAEYIKEFSYHRYSGSSSSTLARVALLRTTYNINTSMLEHGGADYNELHADLKEANVSAWEQYTLAFPGPDNGYHYYPVNGNSISIGSRTKFLRQYFKYIRSGAKRIEATSLKQTPVNDPLAFINPNGKFVVVVKVWTNDPFTIQGLPGGTYGIKYTTFSKYDADLADINISTGQQLTTGIPQTDNNPLGVITIYQK